MSRSGGSDTYAKMQREEARKERALMKRQRRNSKVKTNDAALDQALVDDGRKGRMTRTPPAPVRYGQVAHDFAEDENR
jgi:hypothetical protein